MHVTDRREFLRSSAALTAGPSVLAAPAIAKARAGANDRIRIAGVGLRRGMSHIISLHAMAKAGENLEIASLCDCDEPTATGAADQYEKLSGNNVPICTDMRKLLDDKSIDAVTFGTPDHWHALGAIWACQAGKDVFVEKPCSHTIAEGRKMVQAARKYKRMVQIGTQCRSSPNIIEGIQKIHEGIIGRVYMGRAISYKIHGNLGRHKPAPVPKGLDWNLFVGPAPEQEYSSFRKGRWYWLYDFSNGDMANQAVHQLDIIRWAMKLDTHPTRVQSMGGCLVHDDDRQWPDNQTFSCQYADKRMVTFEHRNWYTNREAGFGSNKYLWFGGRNPNGVQNSVGAVVFGAKGYMIFNNYSSYHTFLGPKREPGPSKTLPGGISSDKMNFCHHPNWIAAIRSRNHEDLSADIEQGHLSTSIALLGNIAYLTGQTLKFDPKTERFKNDPEADKYLTKEYRKPFVVPDEV
jgi:predicted dehydrogenase